MVVMVALLLPIFSAQAATSLTDGEYTIDYQVLTANNDSVSIANDYWDKPAKLFVKNGTMTVQLQLNHSSWIVEYKSLYQGSFVDVEVISENNSADTRVVQFKASDLSTPIESKIHVIVPDIDYDNKYTVRLAFDPKSIKPVQENVTLTKQNQGSTTSEVISQQQIKNPQTGDYKTITATVLLLVCSILFLANRYYVNNN